MKYIVMQVKSGTMTLEIPFLFPDCIVHAMMAQVAKPLCEATWKNSAASPISAGSISSADCWADCYGDSETLKLKSRGEIDSELINGADYGSIFK